MCLGYKSPIPTKNHAVIQRIKKKKKIETSGHCNTLYQNGGKKVNRTVVENMEIILLKFTVTKVFKLF